MADAYSINYANVLPGGFASWKVIPRGLTGVIDLGPIFDGKIVVKSMSQVDSRKRNQAYGVDVDISGKMAATHKTTVLALLDHLVGPASHEILGVNGEFYEAVGAGNTLGLGWRFDSSKDFDGIRFVEILAKGRIMISSTDFDLDDFFAAATAIGSAAPDGGLATWSAVEQNSAGMTSFYTFGQTNLGAFRNGKIVCSTRDIIDNHGRNVPYGVDISVEAELMQTENTELKLINDHLVDSNGFYCGLADGALFSFLIAQSGMDFEFHNDTDVDGVSFIRVVGTGHVPLADWPAFIS